jgi:hypothetical protein
MEIKWLGIDWSFMTTLRPQVKAKIDKMERELFSNLISDKSTKATTYLKSTADMLGATKMIDVTGKDLERGIFKTCTQWAEQAEALAGALKSLQTSTGNPVAIEFIAKALASYESFVMGEV